MLIEKIPVNFEHKDDRGSLIQLVRRGYSQINVITSRGGTFRGGHYHKLNTEAFFVVIGKCQVTASKNGETETKLFEAGDFFRIGPCIKHDFNYIEDSVLVTMYSLGVELEDGNMDCFGSSSECVENNILE